MSRLDRLDNAGDGVRDMLREMANRLFEKECTREVRSRAEDGTWPDGLWRMTLETGLPFAAVPEELGGAGAALEDAAVVMRAAGRHAVPIPLVETLLGNWLLSQAACRPADGPLAIVPFADA